MNVKIACPACGKKYLNLAGFKIVRNGKAQRKALKLAASFLAGANHRGSEDAK